MTSRQYGVKYRDPKEEGGDHDNNDDDNNGGDDDGDDDDDDDDDDDEAREGGGKVSYLGRRLYDLLPTVCTPGNDVSKVEAPSLYTFAVEKDALFDGELLDFMSTMMM